MQNKIAVWTGEEKDHPECLKHSGNLLGLNDMWSIIFNQTSTLIFEFPNKVHELNKLDKVIYSACNDHTILFVTVHGEVWGWTAKKKSFMVLRSECLEKLVKIDGLSDITEVSIGETHAACIDKDGRLYTWGLGESGQLGDPLIPRHGPIAVPNSEIFNTQQVICGEQYTCIRTLGGYIYIFGTLGSSDSCSPGSTPKNSPYTIPDLESHVITYICKGKTFIAALASSGVIILIDSCLKIVKLSLLQREIQNIAATQDSVYGVDKGYLYQWKKNTCGTGCGLKDWVFRVFLLEKSFSDCVLVSGVGKSIGIIGKNLSGPIGKVVKLVSETEDIVSNEIKENKNNLYTNTNIDFGLSLLVDVIQSCIRLTFHRLNCQIAYNNSFKGCTDENISNLVDKIQFLLNIKSRKYFKQLIWRFSSKSLKMFEKLESELLRLRNYKAFDYVKMKLKPVNLIEDHKLKSLALFTSMFYAKKVSKIKLSVIIQLLRFKTTAKSKIQYMTSAIYRVYKSSISRWYKEIFNYLASRKRFSASAWIFLFIKYEERHKWIILRRGFMKLKPQTSNRTSIDSKKSFDAQVNSKSAKYNIKIASPDDNPPNSAEMPSSNIFEDQSSPRSTSKISSKIKATKQVSKSPFKKTILDKSRLSEKKAKTVKKNHHEETKVKKTKNSSLQIFIGKTKYIDGDKSPVSFNKSPIKLHMQLLNLFNIIDEKVTDRYKIVFDILKQSCYNRDTLDISSGSISDIWKLKVYSLGVTKLNAMIKRRLKNYIIIQLIS